eukprot:CAMPEP_0119543096 /NCGR_PEP_ID=MMETSP1344-20130328/53942_1 /TAXON_ID=236787 /ORGANISM="Florenciella parvula, Strain CCMP2471" /LENGTH=186 /DNA_ID=CAMNT_0007587369 /DNA_START=54 /DNA_END=611 /DNA_ORIENTATION=-
MCAGTRAFSQQGVVPTAKQHSGLKHTERHRERLEGAEWRQHGAAELVAVARELAQLQHRLGQPVRLDRVVLARAPVLALDHQRHAQVAGRARTRVAAPGATRPAAHAVARRPLPAAVGGHDVALLGYECQVFARGLLDPDGHSKSRVWQPCCDDMRATLDLTRRCGGPGGGSGTGTDGRGGRPAPA